VLPPWEEGGGDVLASCVHDLRHSGNKFLPTTAIKMIEQDIPGE
jgi:hypothetical protein